MFKTNLQRVVVLCFFLLAGVKGVYATTLDETPTIQEILNNMTVEQKVGQIIQGEIQSLSPSELKRYEIGSILNGGGSYPNKSKRAEPIKWLELADAYYEASVILEDGTRIAPIWGTDAVHGHNNVFGATIFPHNIGLGAANDSELVERIGIATAREVKATGIPWVFAPTVAVAQDYRWGRTYESFGSDAVSVSALGAALVRGFESEGLATTAKHFLGDGGTLAGVDQGNFVGSKEQLLTPHLDAYAGVFEEDVPSVMASFNSWNGEKAHGSKALLHDLLRDEMGYEGLVVSDWNGIGQVAGCKNWRCAQAFNAGIDMIMVPNDWRKFRAAFLEDLASGVVSNERLDEAVGRVLNLKQRYGLINGERPSVMYSDSKGVVGLPEHQALAEEAVRKSLVLLKNHGQVLPMRANARIAVVGSGADSLAMQTGGWSLTWQGNENANEDFPQGITVLNRISSHVTKAGGSVTTDPEADDVDYAVVVFGETPYAEGAGDRQNLLFKKGDYPDLKMMRRYQAAGIPVVSVFLTGRPMWVNREINASDAFVVAWLPGSRGGALADVLLAEADGVNQYDFSGKLPFAWPKYDLNKLDKLLPVDEFIWPVGFGLTYASTESELSPGNLLEEALSEGQMSDAVIFRKNSVPPFALTVGDEGQWVQPVAGSFAQTSFGELQVKSIDVRVQEDARLAVWQGGGIRDSQLYWRTNEPVDLSDIADDGALTMVLNVQKSPKGEVKLRMDCEWPCRGEMDVTKLFKRLPESQWVRLSFPLACFDKAGADLSKINAPLVLIANRPMSLVLLDVAVVKEPDASSLVPCK